MVTRILTSSATASGDLCSVNLGICIKVKSTCIWKLPQWLNYVSTGTQLSLSFVHVNLHGVGMLALPCENFPDKYYLWFAE